MAPEPLTDDPLDTVAVHRPGVGSFRDDHPETRKCDSIGSHEDYHRRMSLQGFPVSQHQGEIRLSKPLLRREPGSATQQTRYR